MLIQVNVNNEQVYVTTCKRKDEEINNFNAQVTPKKKILVIMGDFIANVVRRKSGNYIGLHGLGQRNESVEKLCSFAVVLVANVKK